MEYKLFRFQRIDPDSKEVKFSVDLSVNPTSTITVMASNMPPEVSAVVKEKFLEDAAAAVRVQLEKK